MCIYQYKRITAYPVVNVIPRYYHSLFFNVFNMVWQEKVYEYVCELCHDNGKRVSLLPSIENENSHETSIPTVLEVGITVNTNQRNGKVCILCNLL